MIAALLILIAIALLVTHDNTGDHTPLLSGVAQIIAGIAAGFGIGLVASLLGVAGGEFLIPTLMLLFGADIKLAGSLSLAVSLPTMIVNHPLQPGPELCRAGAQQAVCAPDGGGIDHRHLPRRATAAGRAQPCAVARPGDNLGDFSGQDLAVHD